MKREIKQVARKILPRFLLDRIKELCARNQGVGSLPKVRLDEMNGFVRCTVGDLMPFDAPRECKEDLLRYTSSNEGLSEIGGIARLAARGGILYDIGAHFGLMSALFCAASPRNLAVCIEPSPLLRERLDATRRLGGFGDRMRILPVAIGESPSTLTMLVDPVGGFVQSHRFEHSMWGEPEEIRVPVESIPSCVRRLGIVPDFIKIDIEGFEFEAVTGSLDFLKEKKPVLLFEMHLNYLEQRGLSPKRLIGMLVGCGYRFYAYSGRELRAKELYDSPLGNVRFYCE